MVPEAPMIATRSLPPPLQLSARFWLRTTVSGSGFVSVSGAFTVRLAWHGPTSAPPGPTTWWLPCTITGPLEPGSPGIPLGSPDIEVPRLNEYRFPAPRGTCLFSPLGPVRVSAAPASSPVAEMPKSNVFWVPVRRYTWQAPKALRYPEASPNWSAENLKKLPLTPSVFAFTEPNPGTFMVLARLDMTILPAAPLSPWSSRARAVLLNIGLTQASAPAGAIEIVARLLNCPPTLT